MFKNARLRGSSLIEVSSLLSVLALAAGLLVPAASTVTTESRRLRSVENLRKIGERSFIWSGGREDGIIHPQSTGGETDFLGLGPWDWGGSNGSCVSYGSTGPFAQETRPLTIVGPAGRSLISTESSSVFHAPADRGQVPNTIYGGPGPDALTSMALCTGTSYQGDFIWFFNLDGGLRFGTFMRPHNMIPVPAETTLFYEARFAQAFVSSQEFVDGGAFGGTPVTVPGWYGDKSKFGVLFADQSVRTIRVNQSGDMFPIDSFDPVKFPNRSVMARGPGWRIDCFPAPFIQEHLVGNP